MRTQIWVDDIHPPSTSPVPLDNPTWVKDARDFQTTIDYAVDMGLDVSVDHISFDNDLGDASEKEGYHCFLYLEEMLHNGKFPNLETINVHSDNTARVQQFLAAKPVFKKNYGIEIHRLRRVTNA